jgi:hypothetical protein
MLLFRTLWDDWRDEEISIQPSVAQFGGGERVIYHDIRKYETFIKLLADVSRKYETEVDVVGKIIKPKDIIKIIKTIKKLEMLDKIRLLETLKEIEYTQE